MQDCEQVVAELGPEPLSCGHMGRAQATDRVQVPEQPVQGSEVIV